MQQPTSSQPRIFTPFGTYNLEDVPRVYTRFAEARNHSPILYDENMRSYHVFRYEDVLKALTDYNHFSSEALGANEGFLKDTLVSIDPPYHRKLRNLVNLAFTPRAVARLADRITQITQEQIDKAREQGTMDVVADMAFPLPAKVIAELLGVPDQDWDIFQRWARADTSDPAAARRQAGQRSMFDEMSDYFTALLEERRRRPRADLISDLSVAEIDGERLSQYELVKFCILLLAAGQETTKNLIANAIVCFTDHPDAMERLARDPALMPRAVEEVLRYLPPVWFLMRRTREDVELAGQPVPANQNVLIWTASANRDAAQFPDPDRFDIEREPNRHLAFGHGIHFCLGAPLARLEAKIALPMMLQQLKGLRRTEDFPVSVRMGIVFMIRSLPITFQP